MPGRARGQRRDAAAAELRAVGRAERLRLFREKRSRENGRFFAGRAAARARGVAVGGVRLAHLRPSDFECRR